MNRFVSAISAAVVVLGVMIGSGFAQSVVAGGPSAENTRSFRYIERYNGNRFIIEGSASANAPLACNTRMVWSYGENMETGLIIKANCRIQANHRTGQKVTLLVSGAISDVGAPPEPFTRCREAANSDPESGKVQLSCVLPLPPVSVD